MHTDAGKTKAGTRWTADETASIQIQPHTGQLCTHTDTHTHTCTDTHTHEKNAYFVRLVHGNRHS